jgi:hypothetical protein
MGILFREAAYQSKDSGMGWLDRLIFFHSLRIAGNDGPSQLSIPIPQTQQSFDDAKNGQYSEFLPLNDSIIVLPCLNIRSSGIGRNPD